MRPAAVRRDLRNFAALVLLFNAPALLFLVPVQSVKLIAFLPLLAWVSIPGIPLAGLGFPGMRLGEFGADPEGALAWLAIVLCWVALAGVLSWLLRRLRRARTRQT